MFITLLLISPVLSEWVEISQHHVRKPPWSHSFKPTDKVTGEHFEFTTKISKIYLNQSLTEHPWRANINKVPKLGNIQRVQLDDSPIKAPTLSVHPVKNVVNVGTIKTVNTNYEYNNESVLSANIDLMKTKPHKTTITPYNIERVYPMSILNSKDSFQETESKHERPKIHLSNQNNRPLNELELTASNNPGPRNPNIKHVADFKTPSSNQKRNTTPRSHVFRIDENNKNFVFITEVESTNNRRNDFGEYLDVNKKGSEKNTNSEAVVTKTNKGTNNIDSKDEKPKRDNNPEGIVRVKPTNHEFVTKMIKPIDDDMDATVAVDDFDLTIDKTKQKMIDSNDEISHPEEPLETSINKDNSIENLMNFMKVVAETIKKNTRRSVNSKTRYLTNLKNTILSNIAERIHAAWPDDERPRTKRAAHASARGHLEIPSSESALMTISFLTFAVFLIKLVLQVIQTYKNKAMMVAPAVVAVGRAAAKRNSKP